MATQAVRPQQTEAQRWAKALDRAIADALDVLVEPISGEAFVESSNHPGIVYAVGATFCTCPAGQQGVPCKHRAAFLAQIGELPLPAGPAVIATITAVPADEPMTCLWCNGCGVVPNDHERRYDDCDRCAGSGAVTHRIAA
jgi:hypothetical protein